MYVLRRLNEFDLVLSEKKCSWAQRELLYLGHIVSAEGVRPDPTKVSAITDWPRPKTVTQVRSFLSVAGYYRRFIKGFAKIAGPLYDFTKGSPKKRDTRLRCLLIPGLGTSSSSTSMHQEIALAGSCSSRRSLFGRGRNASQTILALTSGTRIYALLRMNRVG